MSHRLIADDIKTGLGTARVGGEIVVLDEVDSTNTFALEQLASLHGSSTDGTVVFAEMQTAGRGRLGRTWHSPRGASLSFTILLWEKNRCPSPVRLMMAGAVAVSQAVESTTDVDARIRWPNDVYVKQKKLCGILVESRNYGGDWAVAVGMGINCLQQRGHFPIELQEKATSLEIESAHPVDRLNIARAILQNLDAFVRNDSQVDDNALSRLWREQSSDIGSRTTLCTDSREFSGVIVDINPQSGLMLQLDSGGRKIFDPAITSRVI